MSSEKIQELQDDMKVLKNEIKQVLLDIREHLLDHPQPPSVAALAPQALAATQQPEPVVSVAAARQPEPAVSLELERDLSWGGERSKKGVPAPLGEEDHHGSHNGSPNLLTIAALPQWFGSSAGKIGQEKTRDVIEVYEMMEHLPPSVKDILLRIACLDGGESPAMEALLELDSLLSHGRKGSGNGHVSGQGNGYGTSGPNGKNGNGKGEEASPYNVLNLREVLHR